MSEVRHGRAGQASRATQARHASSDGPRAAERRPRRHANRWALSSTSSPAALTTHVHDSKSLTLEPDLLPRRSRRKPPGKSCLANHRIAVRRLLRRQRNSAREWRSHGVETDSQSGVGPISLYDDLCVAYFSWEPTQVEIDRTFRSIPLRIRQAIVEYLGPPAQPGALPTFISGSPTAYVALYRTALDSDGEKKWEACADDQCLQLGSDGIRRFIIGICMEKNPGSSWSSSMLYSTFSVETISLETVELRVENLDAKISINLRDQAGFAQAAKRIIDLLIEFLKSPPTAPADRLPIGFALSTRSPHW